jgi:O-antigen/teichoic acid export membrane protein
VGTIRKQGIYNTAFSYLGVLVGFVNILILQPKMLSPEELGLTRMLFSTSIILGTLYPLGLNGTIIKFFPSFRNKEKANYGFINLILLVGLFSYLIFALGIWIFRESIYGHYGKSPLFTEYFTYVFPMTFFAGMVSIGNSYGFILFRSSLPAFLDEIFNRVYQMIIVSLYFLKVISFDKFLILFMLMNGIQLLILWTYLARIDRISGTIDFSRIFSGKWMEMVKYTLLMALATLASRSLRQVDVVLVGSDLTAGIPLEEVAVYTIAVTIGTIIEVPANALSKIADSKISDALHLNDMDLVRKVYFKSTRFLMVLGGFLFLLVVCNIHPLLQLIGGKYTGGEWVVIIIACSAFFNMATGLNNSIIFYSHRYAWGTVLLVGLIGLSIALCYWFIPLWGIEGAALATALAFFVFNIIKYLIILSSFRLQPFGWFVIPVLVLVAAGLGIHLLIPRLENHYIDILLRSAAVGIPFCLGIYFFNVIPELRDFIKGKKSPLQLFQ